MADFRFPFFSASQHAGARGAVTLFSAEEEGVFPSNFIHEGEITLSPLFDDPFIVGADLGNVSASVVFFTFLFPFMPSFFRLDIFNQSPRRFPRRLHFAPKA